MENPEQKHIFTTQDGEKIFETKEPKNSQELLKRAEERDFKIAEALKRGADFKEIQKILEGRNNENKDDKKE